MPWLAEGPTFTKAASVATATAVDTPRWLNLFTLPLPSDLPGTKLKAAILAPIAVNRRTLLPHRRRAAARTRLDAGSERLPHRQRQPRYAKRLLEARDLRHRRAG